MSTDFAAPAGKCQVSCEMSGLASWLVAESMTRPLCICLIFDWQVLLALLLVQARVVGMSGLAPWLVAESTVKQLLHLCDMCFAGVG